MLSMAWQLDVTVTPVAAVDCESQFTGLMTAAKSGHHHLLWFNCLSYAAVTHVSASQHWAISMARHLSTRVSAWYHSITPVLGATSAPDVAQEQGVYKHTTRKPIVQFYKLYTI